MPMIVAMPKSASTSLLRTLGDANRLRARQIFRDPPPLSGSRLGRLLQRPFGADPPRLRDRYPALGFEMLARLHSDVCAPPAERFRRIFRHLDRDLYKQHLPPTAPNIAALDSRPIVLLARAPAEIVAAYARIERQEQRAATLSWPRPELTRLEAELAAFRDGWRVRDRVLEIAFANLIADPLEQINRIQRHLGFAPLARVTLARERFTGGE